MLNEFGKFVRKLRIDTEELLLDMANKLNVKPSFLSAVELGKKSVPQKWLNQIVDLYNLNSIQKDDLQLAIDNSKKQLTIDLIDKTEEDKTLLLSFARKLDALDTKEKELIFKVLNTKK